jgi:copper transport protein
MLLRLGGAVLGLAAIVLLRRLRTAWWRVLVGAATLVLSFSVAFSGHAGTGRLPGFGLVLGTLHVGAMATWLGGLAYLAAVVLRPPPAADDAPATPLESTGPPLAVGAAVATAPATEAAEPRDEATLAVRRFSAIAGVAIGVVVVSGVLQALRIVQGWSALWDTDYGRLLLVKTGLVLVVLAIAAVARTLVRRRWPARRDLRKSVSAEVVLAAAVLVVTAVLVGTSPNVGAATGPVSVTLVQADTIASVAIDPSRSGSGNAFHVYVSPPGGSLARVQGVEARLSLPSRGLDAIPLPLAEEGVNHFSAYDVQLPYPGEWQLELRVRVTPDETVRFTTPFQVKR